MSQSPRAGRLGDLIQAELGDILLRRFKDPGKGFFTVTGVTVTRDLRLAKVYVSALNPRELEEALAVLERAKGFLRSELGQRIRVRFLPELRFCPDRAAESGQRVEQLLRELGDAASEDAASEDVASEDTVSRDPSPGDTDR
jgi:ribosome-binding factor A